MFRRQVQSGGVFLSLSPLEKTSPALGVPIETYLMNCAIFPVSQGPGDFMIGFMDALRLGPYKEAITQVSLVKFSAHKVKPLEALFIVFTVHKL